MRELCQGCEDAEQRPGASCASVACARNRLAKSVVRRSLSARPGILCHDQRTPQQADGLRHRALHLEWRRRPDAAWIELRGYDHAWWRCDRVEGLRPQEYYRKFRDLRRVRRRTISIPEAGQRVGHCRLRTVAALEAQAHCSNRAPRARGFIAPSERRHRVERRRPDVVIACRVSTIMRCYLRRDPCYGATRSSVRQIHRRFIKKNHRTR